MLALDHPGRGLLPLLVFVALHFVLDLIRKDRVLVQLLEALVALVDVEVSVRAVEVVLDRGLETKLRCTVLRKHLRLLDLILDLVVEQIKGVIA